MRPDNENYLLSFIVVIIWGGWGREIQVACGWGCNDSMSNH